MGSDIYGSYAGAASRDGGSLRQYQRSIAGKADASMPSNNNDDRRGSKPSATDSRRKAECDHNSSASEINSAIGPLSSEQLRVRIAEMFPGLYLTLVAIIQGVAFGVAVTTIYRVFPTEHRASDRATMLIEVLITIIGITLVTHKYLTVAALLRWSPTIFDTLLPYLIGLGEISAALMIGHEASWWFALSLWLFAGAAALGHTMLRARRDVFGELDAYYLDFRRGLVSQIACCVVLIIISLTAGLLDTYRIGASWINVGFLSSVTLGAIVIYLIGKESHRKELDREGIPRMKLRKMRRRERPGLKET